jgi:nitrite reductase/ring-hydroxylating ferredoxin subunit
VTVARFGEPAICADAAAPVGPACPQNWYLVARSAELTPGAILSRTLGDTDIVLYRGHDSGRVVALAAHCAHAGCHLGHGTVIGDRLRCALHHRAIDCDGTFRSKDGAALATPPQSCLPATERFGCIFVFAGAHAAFDLPTPAICKAGSVATRALPPQAFPLPWSTLISNGMDIDHLQAVHDRRLKEPPTFQRIAEHSVRLSYRARVTGSHLSDHMMKWISGDDISTSITCIGGSMMLVESEVGKRRSFVILSMCPAGRAGTAIRAVVGVAGAPDAIMPGIFAHIAAWLFLAFLQKDVGILRQMDWHEPAVEITQGDGLMVKLCNFFRGLQDFDLAPAQPVAPPATPLLRSVRGA